MADQVSVRIAVTGGAQFKQEMASAGAAGQRALAQVAGAGRSIGPAFQNAAFQVQDFIVQVAGGTSATRAFAQQAPQFLSAFGPVGVVLGVVAAVAGALAPAFLSAGDATSAFAREMAAARDGAAVLQSGMQELTALQDAYADAIRGSGNASSSAAALVIANSAAEFAARKQLLVLELQVQKARAGTLNLGVSAARDAYAEEVSREIAKNNSLQAARDTGATRFGGVDRAGNTLDRYVAIGPRTIEETGVTPDVAREVYASTLEQRNALLRAQSEAAIFNQQVRKTEALINTEFSELRAGGRIEAGSGRDGSGGGGGRGGGAAGKMAEEAKRIFDATRTSAERYNAELEKINAAYHGGQIDQDTYTRALDKLKAEFDETRAFMGQVGSAVKSAFGELFDSIVQGGEKAGDVLGKLAQRLASMALQRSFVDLLGSALPSVFGAGGYLPLLNAKGNAFDNAAVAAFAAGGVVSSPHMFGMRGGRLGVMGEAGPEGILPLTRIGGKLGVSAAGTGGGTIVNVHSYGGQPVRQESRMGPDDMRIIDIYVGEGIAQGRYDRALKGRFGSNPVVGGKSRA